MTMRFLITALAVAVLALNGCGGRSARPVTVTQSFDTDMSCAQVASEIEANKVRINSLHKEDADRHGRNAAMATAGVLLIGVGALFLIDDGEAQETEIRAYTARNNHLVQVASTKGCTEEEMAAAVAANSAYTAAAATTAAGGSPAQVAVATAPDAQASQAQAQFGAWYATNSQDLRRAITNEIRKKDRPVNCIAGTRPTELVTIVGTTVLSRDDSGYRVNVEFYKASEASCTGTRNEVFLIRLENDQIAEVSYIGPATSAPPVVTASAVTSGGSAVTAASAPASTASAATQATNQAVLPWAGMWQGETKLPDGRVSLEIVDGQVATRVMLRGKSRETAGPLGSDGSYASSVTMANPSGGTAVTEVKGVFPVFTVSFTTSFNSEPNRTITVSQQ